MHILFQYLNFQNFEQHQIRLICEVKEPPSLYILHTHAKKLMIMNPHYTNIHVARSDQGNVEYQVFAFSFWFSDVAWIAIIHNKI